MPLAMADTLMQECPLMERDCISCLNWVLEKAEMGQVMPGITRDPRHIPPQEVLLHSISRGTALR